MNTAHLLVLRNLSFQDLNLRCICTNQICSYQCQMDQQSEILLARRARKSSLILRSRLSQTPRFEIASAAAKAETSRKNTIVANTNVSATRIFVGNSRIALAVRQIRPLSYATFPAVRETEVTPVLLTALARRQRPRDLPVSVWMVSRLAWGLGPHGASVHLANGAGARARLRAAEDRLGCQNVYGSQFKVLRYVTGSIATHARSSRRHRRRRICRSQARP